MCRRGDAGSPQERPGRDGCLNGVRGGDAARARGDDGDGGGARASLVEVDARAVQHAAERLGGPAPSKRPSKSPPARNAGPRPRRSSGSPRSESGREQQAREREPAGALGSPAATVPAALRQRRRLSPSRATRRRRRSVAARCRRPGGRPGRRVLGVGELRPRVCIVGTDDGCRPAA